MEFKKYLREATTVSPGYTPVGDKSGITGDDDMPTGTTVFGDKMVPVEVPNRLTGSYKKYVPADEIDPNWTYDEFEHSQGMGDMDGYSKSLDGLSSVLGDRLWKHVMGKRDDISVTPDKEDLGDTSDVKLSDDEEDYMDITEQISKYLTEAELNTQDKKAITKAIVTDKSMVYRVKDMNMAVKITDLPDGTSFEYPSNVDFTVALVDIADTLGYDFDHTDKGKMTTFVMKEQ